MVSEKSLLLVVVFFLAETCVVHRVENSDARIDETDIKEETNS